MINVMNTAIIFGDHIINEMFDIIAINTVPQASQFNYKYERLPNGKARRISVVNTENELSITVARQATDATNFKTLNELYTSNYTDILRLVNITTGEVLVEYKNAALSSNNYVGSITDGAGNDVNITWSCINEL